MTLSIVTILAIAAGSARGWQATEPSLDSSTESPNFASPDEDTPERPVVRIWNLTNKPFRYQFHQYEGPTWSQAYTLPPERYHQFNIRRPVRRSVIGNRLKGPGGVIQYQAYGGLLKFRGSAWVDSNAAGGAEYEPNFFYIEDADGNGQIVQGTRERALQDQARLLRAPRKSPAEIDAVRRQLQANHCWLPLGDQRAL
ncbi:MAG: hypothetical protein K2Y37_01520 [Pirellulales bacterium]|nr:hypothetical protein [Pirellulales bacterium]